jgi:hypothetical protein
MKINNGYLYVSYLTNATRSRIQKRHISNFVIASESAILTANIYNFAINNGFLYVANYGKLYESNFTFVNSFTGGFGLTNVRVVVNNSFFYLAGGASTTANMYVRKMREQELTPDVQTYYYIENIKE